MAAESKLVLGNITAQDQLELLDYLGPDGVRFETLPAGGTRAGEPVTMAVVMLTSLAVSGLVGYLLKGRRSGRARIGFLRVEGASGAVELHDVELAIDEEDEPKAQLLGALQQWLDSALKAAN